MPSVSPKQARLMAMVAHDPKAAKRTGIPQSVAKDFNKADAGTGIIQPKKKSKAERRYGKKKMDVADAVTGSAV